MKGAWTTPRQASMMARPWPSGARCWSLAEPVIKRHGYVSRASGAGRADWVHEIEHDGYRLNRARSEPAGASFPSPRPLSAIAGAGAKPVARSFTTTVRLWSASRRHRGVRCAPPPAEAVPRQHTRRTTPPHTRGPGGVIRPNAIVIDVELVDVKG